MAKISIEQAESMVFDLLNKEDLGDRIYEFAQELFQRYIRQISERYSIENPDVLDRHEEWYDGVYEDFHQEVYAKMIDFLTARY